MPPKFYADLHLHSRFSLAVSPSLNLSVLAEWAIVKGIQLLGTGDFLHPRWRAELVAELEEAGEGVYRRRGDPRSTRFLLSAEVALRFVHNGRPRRIHGVLLAPSLAGATRIAGLASRWGKLSGDGRPTLAVEPAEFALALWEVQPDALLIPAHVWTPHFGLLGSAAGFSSVAECFGPATPGILALETGLSADPAMCARVASLSRFTWLSFSDAHSGPALGREATRFASACSYPAIARTIRSGGGVDTVEFFPEEGKYYLDGHRRCRVALTPAQAEEAGGRCPACGRKLRPGVLHRVADLAGPPGAVAPPFRSLVPLASIVAELFGRTPACRSVAWRSRELGLAFGGELPLLLDVPLSDIAAVDGELAERIGRMRRGEVERTPGYDG
ncbi:MAG TPA: endonuclease Q family protein, partial [Candidatus Aminicenantes bacterium]|nr:endonuclease Q family protein [Candidatus Aminicenantes bacterium]